MARYLITSALPYINGIKHLGNLIGSMLPADVHARYRRLQGHEVLFLCATDEHGTPAELAAQEAGLPVDEFCRKEHTHQAAVYSQFGLSFDHFGRSSSSENKQLTQEFSQLLENNGLIEERTSLQVFSHGDGRFLPDRYVEGTCPRCGYDSARGDQCERCGSLLEPIELLNPRSKISGTKDLEIRSTNHLYLLQSKIEGQLREWVDSRHEWPALAKSIAYKWLDEGLLDRSITRDLTWGVPVTKGNHPRPGFENKVYYVWFDAPIEYIAAAVEWADGNETAWKQWWETDCGADDVSYIQFMGKDNVAFHAVSFPITILGSKKNFKTVDRLKAFNWLNWYGGKFSTSQKRGLFMDQALELLPADYWRWYLVASAPESGDSDFRWDQLQAVVNADLANVIGNCVNRIWKFSLDKFGPSIPAPGEWGPVEFQTAERFKTELVALTSAHDNLEFRKIAVHTKALWIICNEYLQVTAPWSELVSNPNRAGSILAFAMAIVRDAAQASYPIIPSSSLRILSSLGCGDPIWPLNNEEQLLKYLEPGGELAPLPILFQRIDNKMREEFEHIYPADVSAVMPASSS